MLRNLTIRTKLALLLLVPLLAMIGVGALALNTINAVKVGGDSFNSIKQADVVVADFLPPPSYLIELHLDVEEIVGAVAEADGQGEVDAAALARFIDENSRLAKDFQDKHEEYERTIEQDPEYAEIYVLVEKAYVAGQAWLKVINEELIPAAQANNGAEMLRLDDEVMNQLFDEHRTAAIAVTELSVKFSAEKAAEVADTVDLRRKIGIGATLALGLLAILIASAIARSIVGPLRRLTAAARRANDELPAYVASVSASEEGAAPEPVSEEGGKEMGTLATALNSMQTTAVELAADQARLRRNVSTMLGNLARRNQALANRTLTFITRLERDERDPDALGNLYKLDHLTTRMRRNAESLLVLSGAESARSWTEPIAVADVVRAALSEIESYERVQLTAIDEVLVRGSAVADIAHLLAELLDNATRFSPPNTTVSVVGKRTDYGYLVSIIDQGLGMSPADIARANRELESLGRVEERSTMVLGLAVVGRLAARNGITVRLSESPYDGVTAQVRLPHDLVQTTASSPAVDSDSVATAERDEAPAHFADSFFRNRDGAPNPGRSGVIEAERQAPTPIEEPVRESVREREPAAAPPPAATPRQPHEPGAPLPRRGRPVPGGSTAPAAPATQAPSSTAPVAAPKNAAAAHDPAAPLAKRVRGANLFDGGLPEMQPAQPVNRSADSLRSALSSFQRGFNRAEEQNTKGEETDNG